MRHLFLIRHGQYNLEGATDKERVLTELGKNPTLIQMKMGGCGCKKMLPAGNTLI